VVVSSARGAVVERRSPLRASCAAKLTLSALVVNRVHAAGLPAPPAGVLEELLGDRLAALVGESLLERDARAATDGDGLAPCARSSPGWRPS